MYVCICVYIYTYIHIMSKSSLPKVSVGDLLDDGIHFGDKTLRRSPKMAPCIYGVCDDIHIIVLQQTVLTVPQKGYAERGSNRQITNKSLCHFKVT